MSGIAGIFYRDGQPASAADLEAMSARLAHRGGDGRGVWQSGPVGLVHRLFWTTPESLGEQQPLVRLRPDGALVLTADARLDNRAELAGPLALSDPDLPDSAFILAAYEKWGEACPAHLAGDFAFALWDGPRERLFCARDPMGMRPFFYFQSHRLFILASELKALFSLAGVPRRLNETRVADYLLPMFEDKAITFFENVWRLPPAHSLTVTSTEQHARQYWSVEAAPDIRLASTEAYSAAFQEIFAAAVGSRLRSAFAIGATLSGGLDSSAVVCQARRLRRSTGSAPLHTFSAVFDDVPACDERSYIEAVLQDDDLVPHFVRADQISPLIDLEQMMWIHDEPFYAPNQFIEWGLNQAARAAGMRVMLDGIDGDSTVSHGQGYIPELVRAGRWRLAWGAASALAGHFHSSSRGLLWRLGLRPLFPPAARQLWRGLRRRSASDWRRAPIREDFARRIHWPERVEAFERESGGLARTERQSHQKMLSQGLQAWYSELRNREAAFFGLERRSPFFDQRLIEFCLGLPPEQKIGEGWTRLILRRAMTGILPPAIQWRVDKSDLSPNFRRSFLLYEGERLSRMAETPGSIEPFVDMARVRAALENYRARGLNADALLLWKCLTLYEWLGFAFGAVVPTDAIGVK